MQHRFMRLGGVILLALGACRSDGEPVAVTPPESFPHAQVTPDCGPADGPALAIFLTESPWQSLFPVPPFVRIAINDEASRVIGRTWTWSSEADLAYASRCTSANSCEGSTSGWVTLGRFAADSSFHALFDVRFGDGGRVRGGVLAEWRPRRFLCGQ